MATRKAKKKEDLVETLGALLSLLEWQGQLVRSAIKLAKQRVVCADAGGSGKGGTPKKKTGRPKTP